MEKVAPGLSEEALRSLVDSAPDGIFVANSDGRYTYVNDSGCRMLGYSRGEITARNIGDFLATDEPECLAEVLAQLKDDHVHVGEWTLRRKDGSTLPVEVCANRGPEGGWRAFVRDISQRKAREAQRSAVAVSQDVTALYDAQQRLRASERLFRAVIDLLPVGVWIAEKDGRIILANAAALRIWQGTWEGVPERSGEYKGSWVDTGRPVAPEEWPIERAVQKGETSVSELLQIQCFDGSVKTVINWGAPIHNEAGEITGAVALNEDVTALYRTQEQLRAAVREREEILAVVTHDLRNPLSGLILAAMSLERKAGRLSSGEDLRTAAAMIVDNARSMSALVDDLLAVATAPSGRSLLVIAPVKAAELVARATQATQPLFVRAGVKLEVQAPSDLPTVQVDANRILRVLANLLDNAMKFTERGGTVFMGAQPVSAGVRFSVGNTGPALSEEGLADMFQPFWQATRKDRRGAGLGLAICRSIIEAHGGSIWAEPADGIRVRVSFELPRATAGS